VIALKRCLQAQCQATQPLNKSSSQATLPWQKLKALQSLGYKPLEAQKLVNAAKGDFTEASDIIRAALKSMNK
jgi:Holliday junction DNA helicase RuvA